MNILWQNSQAWSTRLLVHFCQIFLISADIWLIVRVLENLYLFKSPSDVLLCDACSSTHICQCVCFILVFTNEVNQALTPPGKIGLFAEIRKRLFRSTHTLLDKTQLITKGDEEFSISFTLEEREDQDTGKIVFCLFNLSVNRNTLEKYPAIWYSLF